MSMLYLVLFQAALRQSLVSLLLEGNDDQSDEDVDKEEREDHKVDHIEDGHFYPVAWTGTLVFKGGIHRVLQYTARRVKHNIKSGGETLKCHAQMWQYLLFAIKQNILKKESFYPVPQKELNWIWSKQSLFT